MEANDLQGVASLDPRGMIGMVYVGTSLHCYILSIQAVSLIVIEKKISKKNPITVYKSIISYLSPGRDK